MKKIFSLMILTILCLNLVVAGNGNNNSNNGNSGSIWTTRNDCGDEQQDVNQFAIGEKVYINGNKFDAGDYEWDITGQPGGASCNPNEEVVEGNYAVNESGEFCFEAYTIANDDCGEYKVGFGRKGDNYRVDLDAPVVPEFGAVVGVLTILSALGIFFFVRR